MNDLPIPYSHGVAVRLRAKGPFLKEKLGEALAADNYAEVEHFANLLTAGQDAAELIERASPGTLQFWVSKLLLDEAFEACTRDHNERIAVLTGFRVENVAIPTRVVVRGVHVRLPAIPRRGPVHSRHRRGGRRDRVHRPVGLPAPPEG